MGLCNLKVLTVFLDMIRPEYVLAKDEGRSLYNFLNKIGGDLYTKCYTPAPDTTRSMACFWSGKEPNENFCNVREKWPKYYLNERYGSLVDTLSEGGVNLNFFHDPDEVEVGIFPSKVNREDVFDGYDLEKFTNSLRLTENSFTYIGTQDFHISFNTHGYDDWGVKKAFNDLNSTLDILQEFITVRKFDHIFVFSDHGFLTDSERKYPGHYISTKRNQILMFHHNSTKINQSGLHYNDKFCSIMSLRPSIEHLFGYESACDDFTLWSQKSRGSIYVEDHHSYQPCINHPFEYWGSIKPTGDIHSCTLSDVFLNTQTLNPDSNLAAEIKKDLSNNTSYLFYKEQDIAVTRHRKWLDKNVRSYPILSSLRVPGKASLFRKLIRQFKRVKNG